MDNLIQKLDKIQEELNSIRNELKTKEIDYSDLWPGDVLPDGSIVVDRLKNEVIIAAPKCTEIRATWYEKNLAIPAEFHYGHFEWFIPSKDMLSTAFANPEVKQHFNTTYYWSSTESISTFAFYVNFNSGIQYIDRKTFTYCVRAFRRVEL